MKRVKALMTEWQVSSARNQPQKYVSIPLSLYDLARVRALCDLYPGLTEESVIKDLLSAALDEFEEALPYVKGKKVVAKDEQGDPIYEDIGLTPRFEELTHKYAETMEQE